MLHPKAQILVILGRPFLTTSNTLINYSNSMMKLSFGNMIVDVNIFNMESQYAIFDESDNVDW